MKLASFSVAEPSGTKISFTPAGLARGCLAQHDSGSRCDAGDVCPWRNADAQRQHADLDRRQRAAGYRNESVERRVGVRRAGGEDALGLPACMFVGVAVKSSLTIEAAIAARSAGASSPVLTLPRR